MDFSAVDRIIGHLKLTFVEAKLPPPQAASQELLMAARSLMPEGEVRAISASSGTDGGSRPTLPHFLAALDMF